MTSLQGTPDLDELTITIVIDNATDTLSSIAPGLPQLPEIAYLLSGISPTGQHDGHNCVVAFDHLCVACHGFSALATARQDDRTATVLFDVGPYGDVWLANAERLAVDLSTIDVLFLSHWHWDHSGGITTVVAAIAAARDHAGRPPLVVDVHPDRPDQRGILTPLDVFAMLPPEPTLEAIETAGGNVATHSDVHVVADHFLASGDIPRQTSYETGLPGHHTWHGDQVTLDTGIHDERFLAATVRGRGTTVLTACSTRRRRQRRPRSTAAPPRPAGRPPARRLPPRRHNRRRPHRTDHARPHQPRHTPDRRTRTLHRLASRRRTGERIQHDRLRAQRRRHSLPAQRLVDRRPWASPSSGSRGGDHWAVPADRRDRRASDHRRRSHRAVQAAKALRRDAVTVRRGELHPPRRSRVGSAPRRRWPRERPSHGTCHAHFDQLHERARPTTISASLDARRVCRH